MTQTGTDDDGARRAAAARFVDQLGDSAGRGGENDEFRRKRQFGDATNRRNAVDLMIARIDETEFTFELSLPNIVKNGATDRAMTRTGPDQCDGMR